jgi:hypothetical protein
MRSELAPPVHHVLGHPGPEILDADVMGATGQPPIVSHPLLGPVDQGPEERLRVTSFVQKPLPLIPQLGHELALRIVPLPLWPPTEGPLRRLDADRIGHTLEPILLGLPVDRLHRLRLLS